LEPRKQRKIRIKYKKEDEEDKKRRNT